MAQVRTLAELALQAGGQLVEACIGLPCPAGRSVPGRGRLWRSVLRDNPELAREIEEKIKAQLGVGLAPAPTTTDPAADKQPKDPDKL